MGIRNTATSYGSVTKFFHWTIGILIICMLIYGYFLEDIPKEYAGLAFNIHKVTGLTILTLVVLRLLWAFVNPKPLLPPSVLHWQRMSEYIVHYSLYVCMLLMPLSGWIGSSAANKPPHIGSLNFLLPVAQTKSLSTASFFIHNNLAIIFIALISIHILAAFYHHWIKRDNILRRMMPNRS